MEADYVGWSIGILAIIIAVIFGIKNRKLEKDRQQINNSAKKIEQTVITNNIHLPKAADDEIKFIISTTGPNVGFIVRKTKQKVDEN